MGYHGCTRQLATSTCRDQNSPGQRLTANRHRLFLLAELAGLDPNGAMERAREVTVVGEAGPLGDGADGRSGGAEHPFGGLKLLALEVLFRTHAHLG